MVRHSHWGRVLTTHKSYALVGKCVEPNQRKTKQWPLCRQKTELNIVQLIDGRAQSQLMAAAPTLKQVTFPPLLLNT